MPKITDEIMREAENKHYEFQMGCYFSNSKKISGALLLWSDRIKDFYWNYATKISVDEVRKKKLLKSIIEFYKTKNRQPEIYITPFTEPKNFAETAKQIGFKSVSKDAWMFYNGKEPRVKLPDNFSIKQVKTKEEMTIFADIFHQAYGGASPDEPYGALPKEYGESLIDSVSIPQKGKTVMHYLGFMDGVAVGIATLIFSGKFGCIYNVGTIPIWRGKGIGTILTMNAVADSIKYKAETVFLQTEPGSSNERYYSKLGFSTKFIGESFLLDTLEYGIYQVVNSCVKIKPNENVVILTDNKIKAVATRIAEAVKKITSNIKTYTLDDYGKRPFKIPPFILEDIKKSDAAFVITEYIYGDVPVLYEPINSAVTKSRTRMAALVDIDESLLKDGMNADYEKIGKFSKKIYRIVKNAKKIRVITDLGTDITVTLGYKWAVLDGVPRPGRWVNLPDGEVLTAPKNVDGVVVVDGIIEFMGILAQHPLKIEIKDGFAQKESISCSRKEIKEKFTELVFISDENSCRVGEFAFGTNIFLKNLSGNLLQDEKFPSVHIAFGDPHGSLTGAKWKSNNHMDAIILNPTVFVDGVMVMEKGKYLIN